MSTAMEVDDAGDDDPVIAEYDIFITPEMKHQLYLLQYTNRRREAGYDNNQSALPSELRIKPNSGFMEVDVGVTTTANFDRVKGLQWGQAMKHAKDGKVKGFGLSSGFGKGQEEGTRLVGGSKRRGEDDVERMLEDFEVNRSAGAVLVTQTLGGQIKKAEEGKPFYMVGTFRGNEVHLTEVTGTVQMRPQFHHIDAQAQITKGATARAGNASKHKQATQAVAIPAGARQKPNDSISATYEATSTFLGAAADEGWSRLAFCDEETQAAFALFEQTMLLADTATVKPLEASWNSQQYLDNINGTDVVTAAVTKPRRRVKIGAKQTSAGDASKAS